MKKILTIILVFIGVVLWYLVQNFTEVKKANEDFVVPKTATLEQDWITVPYLGNRFQFIFAYPASWYYENRPYFWNLSHEGYENHFLSVRQNRNLLNSGIRFSIRWYDATNEDLDTWVEKKLRIHKEENVGVLPVEGFTINEIEFRRICIDRETLLQPKDVSCFVYAEKNGIVFEAETQTERQTATLEEIQKYAKAFADHFSFLESPTDQWEAINGAGLSLRIPPSMVSNADESFIFLNKGDTKNPQLRINSEPSVLSPIEWWYESEYGMGSAPISMAFHGYECIFFHLFEEYSTDNNRMFCNIANRLYSYYFSDGDVRTTFSILSTLSLR